MVIGKYTIECLGTEMGSISSPTARNQGEVGTAHMFLP